MRKLKLECQHAATHYGAAACAITEIGVTKDFKHNPIANRAIMLEGDGPRTRAAEYEAFWSYLLEYIRVTSIVDHCVIDYTFTWPDLKLRSISVRTCWCSEKQGPPTA